MCSVPKFGGMNIVYIIWCHSLSKEFGLLCICLVKGGWSHWSPFRSLGEVSPM